MGYLCDLGTSKLENLNALHSMLKLSLRYYESVIKNTLSYYLSLLMSRAIFMKKLRIFFLISLTSPDATPYIVLHLRLGGRYSIDSNVNGELVEAAVVPCSLIPYSG